MPASIPARWSGRGRPDHRDRVRRAVVSRICSSRRPAAASRISARTRSTCAIRCAASRAILRFRLAPRSADALARASNRACRWRRRSDARAPCSAHRPPCARGARSSRRIQRPGRRFHADYLSHAIGEAVGKDAIIFNEYPLQPRSLRARKAGHVLSAWAGRRTRLGPWRGARREARGAG
mgnify:CR=1 FL=1